MNAVIAEQMAALQRIATFSAAVRGHELAHLRISESTARARCLRCGAHLQVYFPTFQPEMDGPVLDQPCAPRSAANEAA
jgi:hypothetical protein